MIRRAIRFAGSLFLDETASSAITNRQYGFCSRSRRSRASIRSRWSGDSDSTARPTGHRDQEARAGRPGRGATRRPRRRRVSLRSRAPAERMPSGLLCGQARPARCWSGLTPPEREHS